MRPKVIFLDNNFLDSMWSADIAANTLHNRGLCKNIYISLLHSVMDRIRAKANIIMMSGVKRDDDVMELFELSVKAEAMMLWYQKNETKWRTEMIDVDGMCRFIDDFCLNADQSYDFVKEAKS